MQDPVMNRPDAAIQFRLALSLFTRLPAGLLPILPPGTLGAAVWCFPLVGALVGLLAGIAGLVAHGLGLGIWAVAVAILAAEVLITGGLHEDGLADVADALGGRDVASRLAIMRDSRIGSFGSLALFLSLAARLVLLAQIGAAWGPGGLVFAAIAANAAARLALVIPLALLDPARPDGLGASVGRIDADRALSGAVFAFGIGIVCLGWGVFAAGLAVTVAGLVAVAVGRDRFGGFTGDLLGAAASLGLVFCLVAIAGHV